MIKFFFFLLLIGAGAGTYLIQSGKVDPEQVKTVIENVKPYIKAALSSVDDAQKVADQENARNAELLKRLEEAKK